ncbi:MAG: glycosyltransferase family 2 protein [Lachnospiraceae bacterium]|nr:glycosyltransferase family 2 protein [Lachnospiraceae bacterium]
MGKFKISIIIPCYNVEKYVERCIDSVIQQTYKNTEIILVNDGSNDKTGDICDTYSKKDGRITVIHKRNGGASSARNLGMSVATGDYIYFIDSDDWISKRTLQYLMGLLLKHDCQCAIGRTVAVKMRNGRLEYGARITLPDKIIGPNEAIKMVLQTGSGAVNKLIKKELIEGIKFKEGLTNEDEPFMIAIYDKTEKIIFGGKQTYFYRVRENSVTTSNFSVNNLGFYFNSGDNVEFIRKNRPELLEYAMARHFKAAAYCSAKLHFNLKGKEGDLYRRTIKKELKNNRRQIISNKNLSLLYKIVALFCSVI